MRWMHLVIHLEWNGPLIDTGIKIDTHCHQELIQSIEDWRIDKSICQNTLT